MLYIQQSFYTLALVCRYFHLQDCAVLCSKLGILFLCEFFCLLCLSTLPYFFVRFGCSRCPPSMNEQEIDLDGDVVHPAQGRSHPRSFFSSSIPSYCCSVSAIHSMFTSLVTTGLVDMVSLLTK
jgi:hypothetical protein